MTIDPLLALEAAAAADKHDFFAEERPEALSRLTALLAAAERAPILLLAGEPGSGRLPLLEAAAHGAGLAGRPWQVRTLDLDGYEDGEAPLQSFLDHQMAKRELDQEEHSQRAEELREVALALSPSMASAAVLSLLLAEESPGQVARGAGIAGASGRENLERLAAYLRRGTGLVLYLPEPFLWTGPARRFLVERLWRTDTALALAVAPGEANDAWAPAGAGVRFDLPPLISSERGELSFLDGLLNQLDTQVAGQLQRLLSLGALAGENLPVDLYFSYVEVTEEEREEMLDWLDCELVEEEEHRLLLDYQYAHPAFPFGPCYGLRTPACRGLLYEILSPAQRVHTAADLLADLEARLEPGSRGAALLLAQLASEAGAAEARAAYRQDLAWWIDPEEAGELTEQVAAALAQGKLAAGEVLATVRQRRGRWPAFRALALLDGLERSAALTAEETSEVWALRVEGLWATGQPAAALAAAPRAVELARAAFGDEHPRLTEAIFTLGFLSQANGDLAGAEAALAQAGELCRRTHGEDHPLAVAIESHTAEVAAGRGDGARARQLFEEALARDRRTFGEESPSSIFLLARYGRLLGQLGDANAADFHLRQARDLAERLYGPDHPLVAQLTGRAREDSAG